MSVRRLLLALALLLAVAAPGAQPAVPAEAGDTLVLGRISDDPRRHFDSLQALIDYVVPRLAEVGIRRGRVLMARDAQQMASYLRRGRVDWVTETAATGLLLAERSGGTVLVATERDGVALYRTVVFVRRDSGIDSLDDLRGRSIAFQNPNSTSAYYAPAAAILGRGLPLEILLSPKDRPRPDGVGYVFARSEANVSAWVHKRLVDAGAFSDIDWNNLTRLPASFRGDFRIIHHTPPFPRGVEVVRPGLAPAVAERLRTVLLGAAADPAAREPLQRFFGTNGFVPVEGELAAALEGLRAAARDVRGQLE
jgi:phosphonate transport system substrate-binding protein